jgi:hypothetical protein
MNPDLSLILPSFCPFKTTTHRFRSLEIFYARIIENKVIFQRKQVNLSKKGGNPDAMIQSLIQEKRSNSSGEVEAKSSSSIRQAGDMQSQAK